MIIKVIKRDCLLKILVVVLSCYPVHAVFSVTNIASVVIASPIKPVNKIAAFVNRSVITTNQVDFGVNQALFNLKQNGITPPNTSDMRGKILEQLIMQQVQLDVANRNGIKVSDLEITDVINNIIKDKMTTLDAFKLQLQNQGLSFESFREQIRNQVIVEKLRSHVIDSRLVIPEDEVNRILSSEAYKTRIDYNLSLIMVALPLPASAEAIAKKQQLAEMAYNELKSGKSFTDVSVKYSNSPNALTGGELGWKRSISMPPVIIEALKPLSIGMYTNVIRLPVGFFIFKVNDIKKSGMVKQLKQYKVRHILIKVNSTMSNAAALQKIQNIKTSLDVDNNNLVRQDSNFSVLAKKYSEDIASGIKGGDLGWISEGETVPQFERAMLLLPINKISDPIRTSYGWHLIEVLGVRDIKQTTDYEKSEIRKELRDMRSSLMYAEWLRDIRALAYVKINDN